MILDYKSFKFKHLIDDIANNFWSFENLVSMEDIRRKCNQMVYLSKFISNKKILNEVVTLGSTKFIAKLCIKINMTLYFKNLTIELCGGPFWDVGLGCLLQHWDPSVLSKRVRTGPITTHLGPACAQTMLFFAETLITCPWQA